MTTFRISVGGDFLEEARARFIDAWHRAERGDDFRERHLAFETWDTLTRALTGKRMDLIRHVRRHEITSIRQLAAALGRDDSDVLADVKALAEKGLLDLCDGRICVDYDAIETTIRL